MLMEIILLIVCAIACGLAYILGVFTARSDESTEQHRAYLKGYKTDLKKGYEKARREADGEILRYGYDSDDGK